MISGTTITFYILIFCLNQKQRVYKYNHYRYSLFLSNFQFNSSMDTFFEVYKMLKQAECLLGIMFNL